MSRELEKFAESGKILVQVREHVKAMEVRGRKVLDVCEEVEGKMRWTETVYPDDLVRMLSLHRQRREIGNRALKQYEFRLLTRSGEIRTISLTIDLVPGTTRSVASLIDITDAKRESCRLRECEKRCKLLTDDLKKERERSDPK
jgi:hypothetical protein